MTDFVERLKRALDRNYRFANEQQNHAEQAAQTNVSIGLMAAAARHSDDAHRVQAMTTERTLRARQDVLEGKQRQGWKFWLPPAQRSLTREERGELESIRRGLAELYAPQATPEAMGEQRLAAFGAVGQRRGFLGVAAASPALTILLSPWTWLVAACAFALVQMGLKERIENQRDAALEAARENYEAAERWRERSEEYRQGLVDAANVAREAAAALEGERRRQSAAAARERRRNREIANVLAGSPEPPDWRLREPEPPEESRSAAPGP